MEVFSGSVSGLLPFVGTSAHKASNLDLRYFVHAKGLYQSFLQLQLSSLKWHLFVAQASEFNFQLLDLGPVSIIGCPLKFSVGFISRLHHNPRHWVFAGKGSMMNCWVGKCPGKRYWLFRTFGGPGSVPQPGLDHATTTQQLTCV